MPNTLKAAEPARAEIEWFCDGFGVFRGGRAVAFVRAGADRTRATAQAFAQRIARDADSYLAVLTVDHPQPGIIDLRGRSRPGGRQWPAASPWYGLPAAARAPA